MCNVKVVASKVPLTVGVNVHTTFGKNKSGKNMHLHACIKKPIINHKLIGNMAQFGF